MKKTSVYDLSGGDEHIRGIALESGIDYEVYHSEEKTIKQEGFIIETWYDENAASSLSAWGAFIAGVGSCMERDLDEAVQSVIKKAKAQNK